MTDRAHTEVLLVEDDPSMARLLRHLLERDGFRKVRHVWNGEQAVSAAATADVILLDQQLPDLRGVDLLPRLLGRVDPPSVIMITAHGSESLAASALRLGADDYLTKDHTLPELLSQVVERTRRSRAQRRTLVEAEADLVRAERLAAIGELMVTLHHELNNPLTAALAEVELALGDGALSATHREGLETIRAALLRIRDALRRIAELRQAGGMEYLAGHRMLALEEPGPAEPPYRGRAVLGIPDPRLARVLGLLLRNEGFAVERSDSPDDAVLRAGAAGVTLLLVGATDDSAGRTPLRPPPERPYTLAVLGEAREGVDLTIPIPFDPVTVVSDLLAAIERRAGPPGRLTPG